MREGNENKLYKQELNRGRFGPGLDLVDLVNIFDLMVFFFFWVEFDRKVKN